MQEKLRVGQFGFTITHQYLLADGTPADISGATSIVLHLEKPDGTTHVRTGALESDGLDGTVAYLVVDGDLDQGGTWRSQFVTQIGGTARYPQSPIQFEVEFNVPDPA